MKRFLIDEDLPRSLAAALTRAGGDAVHVIDAGLRGRPDADVLAAAVADARALVTADLGFSNLLLFRWERTERSPSYGFRPRRPSRS